MKATQEDINFQRIEEAIHFIRKNRREQPSLDAIAEAVAMSPFHFQRIFHEWAGVTPKGFLQYLNIEYAKRMLKESKASLRGVADSVGLSTPSRLHDLFMTIEGMTPGEYRNGGEGLEINYSFATTPFGDILIASTAKGVCSMEFLAGASAGRWTDDHVAAFSALQAKFPNAHYTALTDAFQHQALFVFTQDWSKLGEIKLHLKGTAFQLKVWETLLKIPLGSMTTYGALAEAVGNPRASRAVGSAVGANPVAFLIPCHRVLQSTGEIGGYHWGPDRKAAILGWEAARIHQ